MVLSRAAVAFGAPPKLPPMIFEVARGGALPASWVPLAGSMPEEILTRVRAFGQVMREDNHGKLGIELLDYLAYWCPAGFNSERDLAEATGEGYELKTRCRAAFVELAERFGDWMPPFFWIALNDIISERPGEPDQYLSILAIKSRLRIHWAVADAAIHAAGIATGMMYTISDALTRHADVVFEHGCDCGCSVSSIRTGSRVVYPTTNAQRVDIALQWWTHFFATLYGIAVNKLPFRFGLSPDALRALND